MASRPSHGRTRVPPEARGNHGSPLRFPGSQQSRYETLQSMDTSSDGLNDALCPECGAAVHLEGVQANTQQQISEDAQRRITELEAQVRLLTSKATSAADKLADYEDELRRLSTTTPNQEHQNPSPPRSVKEKNETEPLPPVPSPGEESTLHSNPGPGLHKRPSITSHFSSFLSGRRSNLSLSLAQPPTATASTSSLSLSTYREQDLHTALANERNARHEAEKRSAQMTTEIEDLSSSLFQQANEMVAHERQARAKLEEKAELFEKRCVMLEERVRVLEGRDKEKKRRLDSLEEAVRRSERVRRLLAQGRS